ncbi:hypothetical protein [Acinetobacter sp. CFCC 10889]|uniref:hypothetical protein n=1 Tax=Acinetobacter sp. CFCC 10889 TaxID=1775557 RepID=UPI000DD041AB|nr:hypothetical protein [Acinetobacter sp. CFCC 10889]
MCEKCEKEVDDLLYTYQVMKHDFAAEQGHDVELITREMFNQMREDAAQHALATISKINEQDAEFKLGFNGINASTERAAIIYMRQIMIAREEKLLDEIKHLKASLDERLSNQGAYFKC